MMMASSWFAQLLLASVLHSSCSFAVMLHYYYCKRVYCVQAVECIADGVRELNELLYTKAGRKAKDRLSRIAAMVASLHELLSLMGFDLT